MLETLRIKNIAVIDSAEIPFKPGLNILSGETGAGKSIVLEAISLILGSRANTDLIRSECDEAVVEGMFDLSDLPWMKERLTQLGFDGDTQELLIKRTVARSGKHRIHVNGELSTLSILQNLCEGLVDLCGQHEHQSLIRPVVQLELLDRYGSLTAQTQAVGKAYAQMKALLTEQQQLQQREADREKRADFLKFQIEELSNAALVPGEDEQLQLRKQLLQSGEVRAQTAESVRQILENEENGTLGTIRGALLKLRTLKNLDDKSVPVREIHEALERALAESEEAALQLNRYLSSVDMDPEQLLQVQERLSLLVDLRRKYGSSVQEMLTTLDTLKAEAEGLDQTGSRLAQLTRELEESRENLRKLAKKLSAARKKASELFSDSVTGELKDLKMGEARFLIEISARENLDDWGPTGADAIQFVVQTNRGEAARALGKVASGGELSRLMLAIRRVIADRGGIGVYLFDEIDAGIGGQTAFQVGRKLKSVAAYNQVICITHLPQVASFANHHLVVRKATKSKRTVTEVVELSKSDRKEELARMLGGPELTKKSLENAAELMELAR
jgi:DNA repair protein RecN (Recombination protein N)